MSWHSGQSPPREELRIAHLFYQESACGEGDEPAKGTDGVPNACLSAETQIFAETPPVKIPLVMTPFILFAGNSALRGVQKSARKKPMMLTALERLVHR